jgi:hypothetical protein
VNSTTDGFGLLGEPDLAHAAFAEQMQQMIGTDYGFGACFRLTAFLSRWRTAVNLSV